MRVTESRERVEGGRLPLELRGCPAMTVDMDTTEPHPLGRALNAASELAGIADIDDLMRRAVAFAGDGIGLEHVVLFARDPTPRRVRLRGSWGIAANGQIVDASVQCHEYSTPQRLALLRLRRAGQLWQYLEAHDIPGPLGTSPGARQPSWAVATPLFAGRRLIGVLYNGGGASTPVDEAKQRQAAVLCGCLGMLLLPHRHRLAWRASEVPGPRSTLVKCTLSAIAEAPELRGRELARQLEVSPGHLARTFKREVGISLVEHRHRVLLERFFATLERGAPSLVDAALRAGFGSYAQFHRVYRKLLRASPNQSLSRGFDAEPAAPLASRLQGADHSGVPHTAQRKIAAFSAALMEKPESGGGISPSSTYSAISPASSAARS